MPRNYQREPIKRAIESLNTYEYVIGPAHDGGYYLFGGKNDTDRSIWENVPWSAANTRETFIQNLPSEPYMLEYLTDIDTKNDFQNLINEMPKDKNNAQTQLLQWIETL